MHPDNKPIGSRAVIDPKDVVDRYLAVWNEPSAERRRAAVVELWTEDGAHLGLSKEARGYAALEARIASSYERWVATEGYVFRSMENEQAHHDIVKLGWEMVPAGGGAAESVGVDVLILADDGRIRVAYQFVVA